MNVLPPVFLKIHFSWQNGEKVKRKILITGDLKKFEDKEIYLIYLFVLCKDFKIAFAWHNYKKHQPEFISSFIQ